MLQILMVRVILKELVYCRISSKDNLVQYFQILYEITEMYELKGLYKDIFAEYLWLFITNNHPSTQAASSTLVISRSAC